MGFWIAFLLTGALDCGSGARLEPGRFIAPGIACELPPDLTFPVDSCAWHAPGRLLHVVTGERQRIFAARCAPVSSGNAGNAEKGMIAVREGRTDTEHPWYFDAVSGEVYQKAGHRCGGQIRVNRERYVSGRWVPAKQAAEPVLRELQAVRGLPAGIRRRPWLNSPVPDVVEMRMDFDEEMPSPVRLGDFDAQTAWVGRNPGPGATFIYRLPSYFPAVKAIFIIPGNGGGKTEPYARIRTLRIAAGEQIIRVRFPEDPAQAPGGLRVPWHAVFEPPISGCIEITVEELYAGEKPAISEIAFYTEMDAAPDPLDYFLSKIGSWPDDAALRVAGGFADAQLLKAWQMLEPGQKRKIAPEIARRQAASLVEAQIEMLAWADEGTLSLLTRTLSRPEAREILQAKLKTIEDAAILNHLLGAYLAAGVPDAAVLDAVLHRRPELAYRVRDAVRPADRAALADAWCGILLRRPFVMESWARQDARVREKAVACLEKTPSGKSLQERLAFLRAAAALGDRRLRSRVKQELRRPGPDAVHLQGLETLLHLQPTPRELGELVRTKRPDAQWVLLTHWPADAPILNEIAQLAKSPWPPVARQARRLLAARCHPDFPKLARPILLKPGHEDWFEVLFGVRACGYDVLRRDLLGIFGRRLSADAFSALAHVFAARGEKQTVPIVVRRLDSFFSGRHDRRYLEEHFAEGSRLLWALAAYERREDTPIFVRLARRDLPEPYLEILSSILISRCRAPAVLPARVWRHPAKWRAFLEACVK